MKRNHQIIHQLAADPDYMPALQKFKAALQEHVADKNCKDKESKTFRSAAELHRSLEAAGIVVTYDTINNGWYEHKHPQVPASVLKSVTEHIESRAQDKTRETHGTLTISVSFDKAHLDIVTTAELKAAATQAVYDLVTKRREEVAMRLQAQAAKLIKN